MNKIYLIFLFFIPNVAFSNVRILYNEKETLYLEASAKQVFLHCSKPEGDDPETASFTYVHVVAEEAIYDFFFRRPWSLESCRYRLGNMRKILQRNAIVRVFGIMPKEEQLSFLEADADGNPPPNIKGRKIVSATFEFLEGTKTGCHSYFINTCDDPNRAVNARGRDF